MFLEPITKEPANSEQIVHVNEPHDDVYRITQIINYIAVKQKLYFNFYFRRYCLLIGEEKNKFTVRVI